MKKVFIDGRSGTTGLRIEERLSKRDDIQLLKISEDKKKDPKYKKEILNDSDIVFLCLPDEAAKESVSLIENPDTVVIDTSTAHRINPEWAYGFPELGKDFENNIKNSKRIAVPGCHAGGFIALVYPLIFSGILKKDAKLTCHSITGYSGGGKKMIAEYENAERTQLLCAPRQYALTQQHKHLPEMKTITGLDSEPVFSPIVAPFYSGMEMTVPMFSEWMNSKNPLDAVKEIYKNLYTDPIVNYKENSDEEGFLSAAKISGKDIMEISVFGNRDRFLLTARYDNLGKGASGAAVECLNIVLGESYTKDLEL